MVVTVENAYQRGLLVNAELLLRTDNFVDGSNKTPGQNDLIFQLWKL